MDSLVAFSAAFVAAKLCYVVQPSHGLAMMALLALGRCNEGPGSCSGLNKTKQIDWARPQKKNLCTEQNGVGMTASARHLDSFPWGRVS